MRRRGHWVAATALAVAATSCGGEGQDVPVLPSPWEEGLVRPDTPGNTLLFNFEPSDVVVTHGSTGGHFLVHYTTDGPNAVPAADDNVNSVPDFVEDVAEVYEEVLFHYQGTLGFRGPVSDEAVSDNGGDDRFDVYLVDFGGMGDGNFQAEQSCTGEICPGFMVQENDFAGYGYPTTQMANRILGSHEFFHGVQAAYDRGQGSVMAEGTAVWATESFDPALHDFEYFIDGYLDNPDRSLDVPMPGPVDPFSYGSAIFFQYLEESTGDGTIRALWERCENGANGVADPLWFTELDPLLSEEGSSFAEAFVEFATYNLLTGDYADGTRGYAKAEDYAEVAIEPVPTPYVDDRMRVFYASTQYYSLFPDNRPTMTAAVFSPDGDPTDTEGIHVLLASRQGDSTSPVLEVSDLAAATETVDTNGATQFIVAVVNTLQEGDSRRPSLCAGSPEEVVTCRDNIAGMGGGGGTGGAGGSGGGTDPIDPPADDGDDSGDCGCRLPGSSGDDGHWPALLSLLGLALARRRQRR